MKLTELNQTQNISPKFSVGIQSRVWIKPVNKFAISMWAGMTIWTGGYEMFFSKRAWMEWIGKERAVISREILFRNSPERNRISFMVTSYGWIINKSAVRILNRGDNHVHNNVKSNPSFHLLSCDLFKFVSVFISQSHKVQFKYYQRKLAKERKIWHFLLSRLTTPGPKNIFPFCSSYKTIFTGLGLWHE